MKDTTLENLVEEALSFHSVEPGQEVSVDRWFVGRYQVEKYLGVGSTAIAFLATDTRLDREVVLKICHRHYVVPSNMLLREARILSRLKHPGIVQVYDFGDEATPWAALEYLGSTTLQSVMHDRHGHLPPLQYSHTLVIAAQIAELLEYLHNSAHVYQLDLKPANLAYDSVKREIKMMDFGSVVHLDKPNKFRYGTPGYLAPELYSESFISSACDIFSFGVLWFEMLTGLTPYADAQAVFSVHNPLDWYSMPTSVAIDWDAIERSERRAAEQAERVDRLIRKFNPEIPLARIDAPSEVKTLILSMMSLEPEQRPHAHDICAAIEDCRANKSSRKKPRVFISHSHKDKNPFVDTLCMTLRRRGFDIWVDNRNLRIGDPFWEKIGQAISQSDFVIVVLSKNSVDSRGVAEELRIAQLLEMESNVGVMPIRIDPVEFHQIPIALRARHVSDFVSWEDNGVFNTRISQLCADMRAIYRMNQSEGVTNSE